MKAARRPLFWYSMAMWLLSFVMAGLLIQLGGLIMSDVPTAGKRISQSEFVNTPRLEANRQQIEALETAVQTNRDAAEDAQFRLNSRTLDYKNQRTSFENWVQTRSATQSSDQNPEVVKRVEAIELLKLEERKAQRVVEELDQQAVEQRRAMSELRQEQDEIWAEANGPYEKARKFEVLKVFMFRLALTLPLLLVAGWMIAKKRKSSYWPIYRSFVIFALFAFFVELVPYLPSYGGYVRYTVGIVLALLFAHFSIKGMTRYLQNKKNEERRPETEKRKLIEYETAVKKISDGVCPSCDRQFTAKASRKDAGQGDAAHVDYCVHCGFCLFNNCANCGTRENSFYKFCGSCGEASEGHDAVAEA